MASDAKNPVGRPKGSVNKLTEELRNLLETEPGEHPAVLLKRIANDTKVDVNIRVQASNALMPYMAPKLRNIEVTGQDGGPVEVTGAVFKTVRPPKPDFKAEPKDEDES